MNKNSIIDSVKVASLSLVLIIAVQIAYASWQNPPSSPPNCDPIVYPGCNPPINVSATPQYKAGALALGKTTNPIAGADLDVHGKVSVGALAIAGNISIGGGSPADGMVLTAVDGTGLAQWEMPSAVLPAAPVTDFGQAGSVVTVNVGTHGQTKTVTVPNTPANAKAVIGYWQRVSGCTDFYLKLKTVSGIEVGSVYSDLASTLPGNTASSHIAIIPITNGQFKIERVAALGSSACNGTFTTIGFLF